MTGLLLGASSAGIAYGAGASPLWTVAVGLAVGVTAYALTS